MRNSGRIIVHFSCGAASAVASKIAVDAYGDSRDVQIVNQSLAKDEHPDNERFLIDVERWIGRKVTRLSHKKYESVEQCWRGEKYIVGALGASCTRAMKRKLVAEFCNPSDTHVVGFTYDEQRRIKDITENNPDREFLWILSIGRISKTDCYHIISAAGIALPEMYLLGFDHNNCIGCCKGGKGYWNKVRKLFPEIFAARAIVQRQLNVGFRSGNSYFFLDELDPNEGFDVKEPEIVCNGLFCGNYEKLVELTVGMAREHGTGLEISEPGGGR